MKMLLKIFIIFFSTLLIAGGGNYFPYIGPFVDFKQISFIYENSNINKKVIVVYNKNLNEDKEFIFDLKGELLKGIRVDNENFILMTKRDKYCLELSKLNIKSKSIKKLKSKCFDNELIFGYLAFEEGDFKKGDNILYHLLDIIKDNKPMKKLVLFNAKNNKLDIVGLSKYNNYDTYQSSVFADNIILSLNNGYNPLDTIIVEISKNKKVKELYKSENKLVTFWSNHNNKLIVAGNNLGINRANGEIIPTKIFINEIDKNDSTKNVLINISIPFVPISVSSERNVLKIYGSVLNNKSKPKGLIAYKYNTKTKIANIGTNKEIKSNFFRIKTHNTSNERYFMLSNKDNLGFSINDKNDKEEMFTFKKTKLKRTLAPLPEIIKIEDKRYIYFNTVDKNLKNHINIVPIKKIKKKLFHFKSATIKHLK